MFLSILLMSNPGPKLGFVVAPGDRATGGDGDDDGEPGSLNWTPTVLGEAAIGDWLCT